MPQPTNRPPLIKRLHERFGKHGAIAVVGDEGVLSLTNFVVGVLLARCTSPADYGIYVLGRSLILIIVGFVRALVYLPLIVYYPKLNREESAEFEGSCVIHSLIISCIVVAAIFFYHSLSSPNNQEGMTLADILPVLSLAVASYILRELFRNALYIRLEFWESLKINSLTSGGVLVITIILYLFEILSIYDFFFLFSAANTLCVLLMYYGHRGDVVFRPHLIWTHFKKSLHIGKWISVNALASMFSTQLHPWLLLVFVDAKSVAIYGVCNSFVGMFGLIFRGVGNYYLPRMSHSAIPGGRKGLYSMLKKNILVITPLTGIWVLVGFASSSYLIPLLYSDFYAGYGLVVLLLLIRFFIESISGPYTSFLQVIELPHVTTVSMIFGAAITITLGPILAKAYGLNGVALLGGASSILILLYKMLAVKKYRTLKRQGRA